MLTGINVSPDVFKTRNIIIGFEAVSFLGFNVCNRSIAFKPNGVAALSSPNILAAMFIKIAPVAGSPFGISGNSLLKTGESTLANALIKPLCSPIFITPSHNESTPVSPRLISKAVFDVSNVAFIIAGNTDTSPSKMSFASPITKAMTKKAIQI